MAGVILERTDAESLIAAAELEQALTQILRLAVETSFQPAEAPQGLKALLAQAGGHADFPSLERELEAKRKAVRALFTGVMSA